MGNSHRPSASIIVACIALVFALVGSAFALPGKNSVDKNDLAKGSVTAKAIKKNAVRSKAIKKNAVKTKQLADGAVKEAKIADGAVTGAKVADGSLNSAKISDVENSGLVKASATAAAGFNAARDAAPKHVLLQKGPLSIYGKCFTDTTGPTTYAYIYAESTVAGSAMISGYDYLPGGGDDFLNPDTPEDDREVMPQNTGADDAEGWRNLATLISPNGDVLEGIVSTFVKNGTGGASGNGLYGAGDVCFFKASSIG